MSCRSLQVEYHVIVMSLPQELFVSAEPGHVLQHNYTPALVQHSIRLSLVNV